jgi:uncharacterized protein YdhG (YjbR/CyaY superfamily)
MLTLEIILTENPISTPNHKLKMETMDSKKTPQTIEEYITIQPAEVQPLLQAIRRTIREAAPNAEETISYQMPAFKQGKILVWFGAFKNHISLFPKVSGIDAFRKQLAPYKFSKGTIQFPIDEPLPLDLIADIVRFVVKKQRPDYGKT